MSVLDWYFVGYLISIESNHRAFFQWSNQNCEQQKPSQSLQSNLCLEQKGSYPVFQTFANIWTMQ